MQRESKTHPITGVASPERTIIGTKFPELAKMEGHPLEIDILQQYIRIGKLLHTEVAPRFRELLHQNPQWEAIFEHYGSSPSHFAKLMVALYPDRFLAYSDLYRIGAAINMGDFRGSRGRAFIPPEDAAVIAGKAKAPEIQQIMVDFEIESRVRNFAQNPQQTMLDLADLINHEENEVLRGSLGQALEHLVEISQLSIPAFKEKYRKPRTYQAKGALKGLHNPSDKKTAIGLFHGTRSGKTLTALTRVEYLGIDKTLIVVPAGLKSQWKGKICEYYEETPGTVIIESDKKEALLAQAADPNTKFVIVSYDLLVGRNGKPGNGLLTHLEKIGFGGLIVDEEHMAVGHRRKTKRSAAILKIASFPTLKHLMVLTATPVDRIKDMGYTAHLLDHVSYPTPLTFTEQLRSNPRLSHNALLPLMDRVKTSDVLKLPPSEEIIARIALTPTQRTLYDSILENESMHPFKKLLNLRAVISHQRLVSTLEANLSDIELANQLNAAYLQWQQQARSKPDLAFDSDFLVANGFNQLYLSATANFKGGISEFVKTASREIREVWKGESIPAKFTKIKGLITERLARGEKVIITSGMFTEGITKELEGTDLDQEEFESLLSYLKREFGSDSVLKIDGQDDTNSNIGLANGECISERDSIVRQWQSDRNKQIILISARAAGQGIDLSIADSTVTGVSMILESLPYSCTTFTQVKDRIMSDTQSSPVTYFILEAEDTLEADIYDLLKAKVDVLSIMLDAVALTDEELEIIEASPEHIEGALARMVRSPRQNLSLIFQGMSGKSAAENRDLLARKFRRDETYEEYLANRYDELYLNGYPGNTARAVKAVVEVLIKREGISHDKIADLGSGPMVLSRTLGYAVPSLDISPLMLEVGKRKLQEAGIVVPDEFLQVADLASIPQNAFPDDALDLGVCSLALDCTPAGNERIQAINQMYRSLKPGGCLILTVPEAELDSEEYNNFLGEFKKIGLVDSMSLSGFAKGKTKGTTTFNCWLFVLRKSEGQGEIDPDKLLFSFERSKSSRSRRKERRLQRTINSRSRKSPHAEEFILCQPDNRTSDFWEEKGDLLDLASLTAS